MQKSLIPTAQQKGVLRTFCASRVRSRKGALPQRMVYLILNLKIDIVSLLKCITLAMN